MKSKILAAFLCAALLTSQSAAQSPQKPLLVSTGGVSGTYYRLIEETKTVCGDVGIDHWKSPEGAQSSGSLMNIDNILGNRAELGIVQADALELRSKREEDVKKRIFTLATLHPEEVHVIARTTGYKTVSSNWKDAVFGKEVQLNTVSDLRGRKVGFWGGSSVTIQVINAFTLVGWDAVEFNNQAEALVALQTEQIDAILAVGGQPLGWVEKLPKSFKLLEVSDSMAKQLDAVYSKTTLTYRNLGQDGVTAVSTDALLVTRNYTSKVAIERLSRLRKCLIEKVEEIRDTRDTHPKWQVIEPARESRWQMFKPSVN